MNPKEFEEITVLGKNYWVFRFTAKILPDYHLINDMVELKAGRWVEIDEKEYMQFLRLCQKEYKLRE